MVQIDRWAKQVSTADGSVTGYDKLLVATASRPFIPSIEVRLRRRFCDTPWRSFDTCSEADMVSLAAGIRPSVDLARIGVPVERGIVVDDQMRSVDDQDIYGVVSAPSTEARSTAWWRCYGSRPSCWPSTSPTATVTPPTEARSSPPRAKVAGVDQFSSEIGAGA